MNEDISFQTEDTIQQCSYLIDFQKQTIENQCLLETGNVKTYQKKREQVYFEKVEEQVSCLQSCPQQKEFYYGYFNGNLKNVKQKQMKKNNE